MEGRLLVVHTIDSFRKSAITQRSPAMSLGTDAREGENQRAKSPLLSRLLFDFWDRAWTSEARE